MPANWYQHLILGTNTFPGAAPPSAGGNLSLSEDGAFAKGSAVHYSEFSGTVYIASSYHACVFEYDPVANVINIYAGTYDDPAPGAGNGDGGQALASKLGRDLRDLTTDPANGDLYICDGVHKEVRKVTRATGVISTLVTGLGNPYGIDYSDNPPEFGGGADRVWICEYDLQVVKFQQIGGGLTTGFTCGTDNPVSVAVERLNPGANWGVWFTAFDGTEVRRIYSGIENQSFASPVAGTLSVNTAGGSERRMLGLHWAQDGEFYVPTYTVGDAEIAISRKSGSDLVVDQLLSGRANSLDAVDETIALSLLDSSADLEAGFAMDMAGNFYFSGIRRVQLFRQRILGNFANIDMPNDPRIRKVDSPFAGADASAIGLLTTKWPSAVEQSEAGGRNTANLSDFLSGDSALVFVGSSYSNDGMDDFEQVTRLVNHWSFLEHMNGFDFLIRGHGDGSAVDDAGAPTLQIRNGNGVFNLRRFSVGSTITDYAILAVTRALRSAVRPMLVYAAGLRDISTKAACFALTNTDHANYSTQLAASSIQVVRVTYEDTVTTPAAFTPSVSNVVLVPLKDVSSATP